MTERERRARFRAELRRQLRSRTRLQRDTAAEVVRLLREAERLILARLPNATEWESVRLPQLQAAIREALATLGEQLGRVADEGQRASWAAGIALVDAPIAAGGVSIQAVLPTVNTDQLLAMRTFLTDRLADVTVSAVNRINAELGLAAIGAQGPAEAVTKISRILGTTARGRAITIVRTELGRAYSVAAQERREQAAAVLPGLKKQWRRSGKVRARSHHDQADGQVVANDERFTLRPEGGGEVKLRFPRDPAAPAGETINCGCEALPYMESWQVKNPGAVPFTDAELRARQVANSPAIRS